MEVGKYNFTLNGYEGNFMNEFVSTGHFTVDRFLGTRAPARLDVLHSDIQGDEAEMLAGASIALRERRIDYVFVSTHSHALHQSGRETLGDHGYLIEVSCDVATETTSFDGLVFARSPDAAPVLPSLQTYGRIEITLASPEQLVTYLRHLCPSGSPLEA